MSRMLSVVDTVDAHKTVIIKAVVLLVVLVSVAEILRLGDNVADYLKIETFYTVTEGIKCRHSRCTQDCDHQSSSTSGRVGECCRSP